MPLPGTARKLAYYPAMFKQISELVRGNNVPGFLVVGTGRCGTTYLASMLTAARRPCTHEKLFHAAGVNRKWKEYGAEGDSSWMAVPFLECEPLKEVPLIHVVRNPRNVLQSLMCHSMFVATMPTHLYEKWLVGYMPELQLPMSGIDRACSYWLACNLRIEESGHRRPYLRHRIEDDDYSNMFGFLGDDPPEIKDNAKWYNHPTVKRKNLDDLLFNSPQWPKVVEMAQRYGYEL